MNNPTNIKFSSHFVVVACLSGGLTIGLSLVYILLCIAALITRIECANGDSMSGASYFWQTIFSAYILDSECAASENALVLVKNEITGEYTVFVLTAITLSVSILCMVTAIILITAAVQTNKPVCNINLVVFTYVASCIASLVVDLTTATHFGLDYSYLSAELGSWQPGHSSNYRTEVLRQGAFLLMSIAVKGYVAPVINCVLLILLVVYVVEHRKLLKSDQHSIHKLGALTAYDQPRKVDENWSTVPQPEMFSPFARGAQLNNGFINDDDSPPPPSREPKRPDYNYTNRSFDRSDSWHHSRANAPPSSRPFSYTENVKRPVPSGPPTSPAVEWPRDPWPQLPPVPVPAPDYSPQPARRLKSALKPL